MAAPTEKSKRPNDLMRFSGFGLQIVVSLCLAAYAGLKLDDYFELKVPIFLIVLLLTTLGGTMYLFIKKVSQDNK